MIHRFFIFLLSSLHMLFDVIVDIYQNPNAGLSSAEQLEKIFDNSLKPIVELTGGLID